MTILKKYNSSKEYGSHTITMEDKNLFKIYPNHPPTTQDPNLKIIIQAKIPKIKT
jgi:hypothetical protein